MRTLTALFATTLVCAASITGGVGSGAVGRALVADSGGLACQRSLQAANPAVAAVYYHDTAAGYWLAPFTLASPGATLRVSGQFPHARYVSITTQNARLVSEDTIDDVDFRPGAGVANPFLAGAMRDSSQRRFTVTVARGPAPATRAPGTVYTGREKDGSPVAHGFLAYRIYVPDDPSDPAGGEALPGVSVLVNGRPSPSPAWESCQTPDTRLSTAEVDHPDNRLLDRLPIAQIVNRVGGHDDNPPQWTVGSEPYLNHSDRFGYFVLETSRQFGPILEIQGRGPSFPDTRGADRSRLPRVVRQLRYWSLCQYQPGLRGRSAGCIADDQMHLDASGRFHLVISTPDQRPANATPRCGYDWIPWGPQSLAAVQYRQFLASPSFTQGAYRLTSTSSDAAIRRATGPYYPQARYFGDKGSFQAQGCR